MKAAPLTLNRLEFTNISIEANENFNIENQPTYAPQLEFNFQGIMFRKKSSLAYPDDEVDAPKNFALMFELAIDKKDQKEDVCPPYFFRVAAQAFLTLERHDFDNKVEVFRAVRQTGYSMIYGAMREMVANLTCRSTHGMMQLPTAQFQSQAKLEAEADEKVRVKRLPKLIATPGDSSDRNIPPKKRATTGRAKVTRTVKAKDVD